MGKTWKAISYAHWTMVKENRVTAFISCCKVDQSLVIFYLEEVQECLGLTKTIHMLHDCNTQPYL